MLETKYFLTRHAETTAGQNGRIAGGQTNVPLSEKGRQQAETLVERFSDITFDVVFASPSDRAINTALPLARAQGLQVITTPLIAERPYGHLEFLPDEEIPNAREALMNYWLTGLSERRSMRVASDMETDKELRTRGDLFLDMVNSHYEGATVGVFSHVDFLGTLLAGTLVERNELFAMNNTGFAEVHYPSPRRGGVIVAAQDLVRFN